MDSLQALTHVRARKDDAEGSLDPVYHALSRINGKINRMTKAELQKELVRNGLCDRGVKEVLRKRLKNCYKKQKLAVKPTDCGELQCYPYLIVVDFEATCEEVNPPNYLHEIIEFPAVLINTKSKVIIDAFHQYCKPTFNPILSTFCTNLTGISQNKVEESRNFTEVLESFQFWLHGHELLSPRSCAFVTDGSWDFSRFLNVQCCLSEIQFPKWAKKWINLKKVFGNFYGLKRPKVMDMLQNIGLQFEGRHHCGFDDANNLARIVIRLLDDGAKFQVNERLKAGRLEPIPEKERLLLSNYDHTTDSQSDVDKSTKSIKGLCLDEKNNLLTG